MQVRWKRHHRLKIQNIGEISDQTYSWPKFLSIGNVFTKLPLLTVIWELRNGLSA